MYTGTVGNGGWKAERGYRDGRKETRDKWTECVAAQSGGWERWEERWGEGVTGRERARGTERNRFQSKSGEREGSEGRNKRRVWVFFNLYVSREDFAEQACSFSATPSLNVDAVKRVHTWQLPIAATVYRRPPSNSQRVVGQFCALLKGISITTVRTKSWSF